MPYVDMMTPRWMTMDTHKLTIQLLWSGRKGKSQNMAGQCMASIKFVSNNRYHTNAKIKEFLGLESDERNKPLPKKRTSVPPSRYTDSDETDVENTPTQRKRTVIPKPQRNVAQMIVDEYQVTTLTETQKKLKDMEEENEKLRNDNEKLRTMLIRGMYCSYFTIVLNHAISYHTVLWFTFFTVFALQTFKLLLNCCFVSIILFNLCKVENNNLIIGNDNNYW
ncbi:uncharacterized protein LOC131538404 [Onychostoma macrolepis]|uniref:uncharacterized protein LOC131538404 n=1 Tax=Onychostoma macrolepis TaxID=369639 RepID=UPI0027298DEB|nr:uncharacterized protein LOC131538404 [Onychostoma macrolepis]